MIDYSYLEHQELVEECRFLVRRIKKLQNSNDSYRKAGYEDHKKIQSLQERIEEMEQKNKTLAMGALVALGQAEDAWKLATQRGARMQIMREWMLNEFDGVEPLWHAFLRDRFLRDRMEADDWFDADGVPVQEGRE